MNSNQTPTATLDLAEAQKVAGCFTEIDHSASTLLNVLSVIDADNPPSASETAALLELMGLQIRRMAWVNRIAADKVQPGLLDAPSLADWFGEPSPCEGSGQSLGR